jgi:hypothetical protein
MVKLKVRNGQIFEFEHMFKNHNYIGFYMDWLEWGLGFNFCLEDSYLYIDVDFLCIHLDLHL